MELDPVVRVMRECGVPLDVRSRQSLSFLHRAVALGKVEALGTYRADVNAQDAFGYTPLHYAVLTGREDAAKDLLEFGADPNVVDGTKNAYSALHLAAKLCELEMVQRILAVKGVDLNLASARHGTALHLAMRALNEDIVFMLTNFGADINAADPRGNRPLHILAAESTGCETIKSTPGATKKGCAETLLLLLHGTGTLEVDAVDDHGRTALHIAAAVCNQELVVLLLRAGADPNARDHHASTPLHAAVMGTCVGVDSGMQSCVAALLMPPADGEAAVDLDAKDADGLRPVDVAALMLKARAWRKGEKTALQVALKSLDLEKRSRQKVIEAAQSVVRANEAAEMLLAEEDAKHKNAAAAKGKGKKRA